MSKNKFVLVAVILFVLTGCAKKEEAPLTSYICFVGNHSGVPGGTTSIVRGRDNKIEILEFNSVSNYKNSVEIERDPDFMAHQIQHYELRTGELSNIEGIEFNYAIHGEQINVYTKYDFTINSVKELQKLGVFSAQRDDAFLYIDKYLDQEDSLVKETNETLLELYKNQEELGFPIADEFKYEVQITCSIID